MAIKAICVACGKPKKAPRAPCPACHFTPETEYQIARALLFSLTSVVGGVSIGREAEILKNLSTQISTGRPYEFDPAEVEQAVGAWRRQQEQQSRAADLRRKFRRRAVAGAVLVIVVVLGLTGYFLLRT